MKNVIERRKLIKSMIIDRLQLKISVDDIGDEQPLFSGDEDSLELDSVEALEIVAGLECLFNINVILGDEPQKDFYSVAAIEELVKRCEADNAEHTA